MVKDSISGTLKPFDFVNIYEAIPELKKFNCEIDFYAFHPLIDSSDMQPQVWVRIAKHIEEIYDNNQGFIILHGTDTMAYTASALSFMLENLGKPVILTGSQLPFEAIRTDAKTNLLTTIEIILSQEEQKINLCEVCIFFNDQLFRGNRSEKFSSEKFDAFKSANYPVLAEAGVEIVYNSESFLPPPEGKLKICTKLDAHVGILKIFPGMQESFIASVLGAPGLKGLVLETFGSGNAPSNPAFSDLLRKAIEGGLIVVNVSQCMGGSVDPGKYHSSYHLKEIGVISGADLTTESAVTKLMFLFGKCLSSNEVKMLMQKNLRGELSDAG